MKALGLATRALAIELIALGGILWLAAGLPTAEQATRVHDSVVRLSRATSAGMDRESYVEKTFERIAVQVRSTANQLVDEALATWFNK